MTTIGFIGLGNMGNPMAQNLIRKGYALWAFDQKPQALEEVKALGATPCERLEYLQECDIFISMLPQGPNSREVYMGDKGLLNNLSAPKLLIDCSTIDMETSMELHKLALEKGHQFLDAPVSGGVAGAKEGLLTFMVGGLEVAYESSLPILKALGNQIFYAGGPTCGLAAKICNNLMVGIHMVGTCEAFLLADRLGLDPRKLHQIASASSGQSWTMNNYCPVSDVMPNVPANNDYLPGFKGSLMLQDLILAVDAAHNADITIPLTEKAQMLYEDFCNEHGHKDFSAMYEYLNNYRF